MNCPKHNSELVHRQGVSKKTGKPYDFWACSQKDGNAYCDYTYNEAKVNQPQRTELEGKVLASMNTKLDTIIGMLTTLGAVKATEPDPNQTKVPF